MFWIYLILSTSMSSSKTGRKKAKTTPLIHKYKNFANL